MANNDLYLRIGVIIMLNLTVSQVLKHIENETSFEGILSGESEPGLYIKVEEYVPYICCALHHGHKIRPDLESVSALTPEQRYHQEDPFTGDLIGSLPVVLVAQDSRYEYDLNLRPDDCIYYVAWGSKVWKRALTEEEQQVSFQKHAQFYEILTKLTTKIIDKWAACLIFDVRSYNTEEREYKNPPIFNIGSDFLNKDTYERSVRRWEKELAKIKLPNIDVSVGENEMFYGNAYLAAHMAATFKKCLVLPTEISKIFYDMKSRKPYPLVIDALKAGLKNSIIATAIEFSKKSTSLKKANKTALLSSNLEEVVLQIDKKIYSLGSGLNTLAFLNPINYNAEKKKFFSCKFRHNPQFKYKQLNLNPYKFKEALYRLPVDDIADITLLKIYRASLDALAVKVEMLSTIGTNNFLYNSLKYYGEPSLNDKKNAHFILHLHEGYQNNKKDEEIVSLDEVVSSFKEAGESYGLDLKIELSNKIVANALVNNMKVVINKNLKISAQELKALVNHELGVHVITMNNAIAQPLDILKIGLPFNTLTQEGLAILSEYLCGALSIKRLKILSLRVLGVTLMLKGHDFKHVFMTFIDEYKMDPDDAFSMVARIFRGGGFTKDYLYLRGFKLAYKAYMSGVNVFDLLIGKTSFQYHSEVVELIERNILVAPKYRPHSFVKPIKEDSIISYIVNCIY